MFYHDFPPCFLHLLSNSVNIKKACFQYPCNSIRRMKSKFSTFKKYILIINSIISIFFFTICLIYVSYIRICSNSSFQNTTNLFQCWENTKPTSSVIWRATSHNKNQHFFRYWKSLKPTSSVIGRSYHKPCLFHCWKKLQDTVFKKGLDWNH